MTCRSRNQCVAIQNHRCHCSSDFCCCRSLTRRLISSTNPFRSRVPRRFTRDISPR
jgi:hypothetical protein